jgi:cytosine/adenosine deaminase-related metal-dependent hydrolase
MDNTHVLSGRWIFPASAAPLERGTIAIEAGRVVAVESRGVRTPDQDLGNVAIIPGLVNAHTHLDLSGLRGKVPLGPDFIGWLKSIIDHRRAQTPDQILADARQGLEESLRFGTTLLGDISADGATWPLLENAPCWSVLFRELLGLPVQRTMSARREAERWIRDHPDGERCRTALSPHAPYSVHQALIRAGGDAGVPQTIHLAETRAELELLEMHSGPFVDFLRELDVWEEDGLAPSPEWIVAQAARSPFALFAHCNYLSPDMLIPANTSIVYCPRTHAAFGHSPHPFREFLARGVRVALGTDSLASNPDLDVLTEACFIHDRYPDFSGEQLLQLATLSGAEALGCAQETGSLEPGKWADLVAVPLPNAEADDPHELLFRLADLKAPRRTMWRGEWR